MVARKDCWAKAVARKLADIFEAGKYKDGRRPFIVHYMTMMQVAFEGMPITPGMYDEAQRKLPQIRNYLEKMVKAEVVLVTREPFGITDAATKAKRHPLPVAQGNMLAAMFDEADPAACIAGWGGGRVSKAFGLYVATGQNDRIHAAWCETRANYTKKAIDRLLALLDESIRLGLVDKETANAIKSRILPEPPMNTEEVNRILQELDNIRARLPAGRQVA